MKGVLFGCLVLWIINIAINVPIFVENVYTLPAIDNSTLTSSTIALILVGFLLTAIPSVLLSIVLPIITLRHLKAQVVLGDVSADVKKLKKIELNKAVAKLSLYLIIGSTLSFLGHLIPVILLLSSDGLNGLSSIIALLIHVLSLLPTPILFVVFLKHVQENAKRLLCFCCRRGSTHFKTNTKSM